MCPTGIISLSERFSGNSISEKFYIQQIQSDDNQDHHNEREQGSLPADAFKLCGFLLIHIIQSGPAFDKNASFGHPAEGIPSPDSRLLQCDRVRLVDRTQS